MQQVRLVQASVVDPLLSSPLESADSLTSGEEERPDKHQYLRASRVLTSNYIKKKEKKIPNGSGPRRFNNRFRLQLPIH